MRRPARQDIGLGGGCINGGFLATTPSVKDYDGMVAATSAGGRSYLARRVVQVFSGVVGGAFGLLRGTLMRDWHTGSVTLASLREPGTWERSETR